MNVDRIQSLVWSIESATRDIQSHVADLEWETEQEGEGIQFVEGDQLYIRDLIADRRRETLLMKDREPTDIELAEAIVDYLKNWVGGKYA